MQEVDLYIVTLLHFDNELKTLAPIFYTLIFVLYLGNNIIFGELLLGKAQPFQYITITLSISIIIHYSLIKLCCQQKVYITQEIHYIGIGCGLLILSSLLSYQFNVMSYYSIFIIKGWIIQSINETHLLGEIYKKQELICLIFISIGAILCTFEWEIQLWGIIFGWLGAASMVLMAHNLKKIKKTKTHTITQYCMLYTLIILGLFYPIHKFGIFNIELIIYCIINGVLFPLCLTIFLHAFQIGCPSMNWAIFMLINMSGAALQIGHSFDLLSIVGIIISLISISYLLLNNKPNIEVGGFEIEQPENPYYELDQYSQRV